MKIEILKTDLDVFEKQAALMGCIVLVHATPSHDYPFVTLSVYEGKEEPSNLTAYYLASNFQLEIRRLTLEKVLAN